MTLATVLEVALIPALSDNYVYAIRDVDADVVGVVDPGAAAPVIAALEEKGWTPDWILLTHHHADHIGGVAELVERYGAKTAGHKADAERLPKLDVALRAGEDWDFGSQLVEIFDTPGHTVGHIGYHFPKAKALFSGDTLFALGCGRLFEGTALQMWGALASYAKLPPETSVYCGHEYTLANARFCAGIEAGNAALQDRLAEIEAKRAKGEPTVPTTIGRELATNTFMRAAEPSVQAAVGLPGGDPAAVFAEIRRRKDAA